MNIATHEQLWEQMPHIHSRVTDISTDPHLPILVERNLEIELSLMQCEHFTLWDSLDTFPGLDTEQIEMIIKLTYIRDRCIADIDGNGYLDTTTSCRPLQKLQKNKRSSK